MDATPNAHEEAETMLDRSVLKSKKNDSLRFGHKYSWLVRLMHFGTSWAAPVEQLLGSFTAWMMAEGEQMSLDAEAVKAYELANPLGMSADGLMRYWKKVKNVGM